MPFRTIMKTGDTGGLDRARVREAVIRLRDRKRYAIRPGTGLLVARERPLIPYGESKAAPAEKGEEGEGEGA